MGMGREGGWGGVEGSVGREGQCVGQVSMIMCIYQHHLYFNGAISVPTQVFREIM